MTKYVAMRKMSTRGKEVCLSGWALLILACVPIVPGMAFAVLLAWGSVGAVVLSDHVGLESQTSIGMVRWAGLFMAWPLALRWTDGIFLSPVQWSEPPRTAA